MMGIRFFTSYEHVRRKLTLSATHTHSQFLKAELLREILMYEIVKAHALGFVRRRSHAMHRLDNFVLFTPTTQGNVFL